MMELLTHGGEHHEIGDGGWLMMTMATDSPLRSPERTPDQPSREVLGLGGASMIRLQRIYNFLLLHAILSTVLDIIGLYYPLLYYFWVYPINRRPSPELLFFCLF